jgi:hypothetical protein
MVEGTMKRLFFILAFLSFIFFLFADYAPQCLLINSYDEIEILSQDPNSLVTNCTWFNILSKQYQIDYLYELFTFDVNQTKRLLFIVYNIKGQLVKTLAGGFMNKGKHSIIWEGKDTFAVGAGLERTEQNQ